MKKNLLGYVGGQQATNTRWYPEAVYNNGRTEKELNSESRYSGMKILVYIHQSLYRNKWGSLLKDINWVLLARRNQGNWYDDIET